MEDNETQENKTFLIFFSDDAAGIIGTVGYSQDPKSLTVEVLKLGLCNLWQEKKTGLCK
jgi:hypothetical protein